MNAPLDQTKLKKFRALSEEYLRRVAKDLQSQRGWYERDGERFEHYVVGCRREGGLIAFVRYFWHVLEPETPFVDGWPLWAMCEHLEAVTFGEITRLLINVPPGFAKSIIVDCFWPAWEWGPMKKTHYRYVAFSYSASLTERDNDRFRTLITSEDYQRSYGPLRTKRIEGTEQVSEVDAEGKVQLRNKTTIKVMNTRTGWKLASSVGGVATGERGDRIIIDDPHSVQEAESERVRDETVRWFRESISSRFNNLETGALVIIMQRVQESDVSGVALGPEFDYCHCMIPWEFEPERIVNEETDEPYLNEIGWIDPRLELDDEGFVVYEKNGDLPNQGVPAWPERFPNDQMARLQRELGEYGWAGQYQQRPSPRGGGLFRRDQWRIWSPEDGHWPQFDYVLASLDAAATEKEENCPSGFTIWGTFRHPDNPDNNAIMLIDAWRKRLKLHGVLMPRQAMEIPQMGDTINKRRQRDLMWRNRCGGEWGLVEWIAFSCRYHLVDLLIIESEKTGIAVAQEIQRLYADEPWGVQLSPVKGDKYARALSVQPMFSQGKVWSPIKDWAEICMEEMESFPRGKYMDLTDSATLALRHLRMVGLAPTDEEIKVAERERITHRPRPKALYNV
jgi:predicted phage terminase large subunit-like protein